MSRERTMRSCRKTACRWPAAASLSYRYDTRQVWLLDLSDDPDPSLYDLCPHHADNLVVMRGWEKVDQRSHAEPIVEPAGRDLLSDSGRPPVGAGGYGSNRYSALVEDLPRVAASLAHDDEDAGSDAGQGTGQQPEAHAAPVVPSRDLAPMPPHLAPPQTQPRVHSAPPDRSSRTAAPAETDANVVSISSAAGRRRGGAD